jgi:hypothetical protein
VRLAPPPFLVGAATVIAVACALFASSTASAGGQNPGPNAPNPLVGQVWWDQNTEWNDTWNGYRSLRRRGRMEDARKVLRLAETPQFRWFGMWEQPVIFKLRGMFEAAGDAVPLLAVFGDDHSCDGNRTGGGAAGDAKYRRWIDKVARGIGVNEVVIAFEPDSLGLVDCLIPSRRGPRLRTLGYGVKKLSKLPNATVYIEAGASDWMHPQEAARKLKAVGVRRVRGFMLNATHMTTKRREHPPRAEDLQARGRQALHHQHVAQRQRAALQQRPHDLVQPAERGRRHTAHDQDRQRQGRRLPLGGAARILERRLQRRSGARWRPVGEARDPDGRARDVVPPALS